MITGWSNSTASPAIAPPPTNMIVLVQTLKVFILLKLIVKNKEIIIILENNRK